MQIFGSVLIGIVIIEKHINQNEVIVMELKLCDGCSKVVAIGVKYCNRCQRQIDKGL